MTSHASPSTHKYEPRPERPLAPLSPSRAAGKPDQPAQEDGKSKVAQRHDPKANFIAGAIGGMTAAVVTSPLEVLKTRLQSDFYKAHLASSRAARGIPPLHTLSLVRSSTLHIRETFQILFAIPRVEGWHALFKGLGPTLVGVVPARAINFFCYGNGKRIISQRLNDGQEAPWVNLMAAANAGIITGTATCPIWVIKTRLQLDKNQAAKVGAQSSRRYRNALDCTLQTFRQEGIRGLYRGLGASYLGVTESTMQWVLFEELKRPVLARERRREAENRPPSPWDHTIHWVGISGAAGVAKCFAAVVTYPHEVIRTRLRQAPMENGQIKYTGIVQCFRTILAEEGVVALYGGLVPHMLRVVPSAAIMFGCYEAILKLLGTDAGV